MAEWHALSINAGIFVCPKKIKTTSISTMCLILASLMILFSGDVESNPGPGPGGDYAEPSEKSEIV